jgi:hypothetical protein
MNGKNKKRSAGQKAAGDMDKLQACGLSDQFWGDMETP